MSESAVCSRTVTIVNHLGLHARPAARLVTTAEQFDAEVTVSRGGNSVPALSIMGLMMLGASRGESVTISAYGPQAEQAVEALTAVIADGFGERD